MTRCVGWDVCNKATVWARADVQVEIRFLAVRVRHPRTPTRCKVEHVFPVHIGQWDLGLETRPLPFFRVNCGVIFLFASTESVALLPVPDFSALLVVSCCAFEITIEPEPKRSVLQYQRAGQNVFTINLSTSAIDSVVSVNPVAGAIN
jgi:hypothetical protein